MREIVGKAMAEFLAGVDDLDAASRAVDREREIRIGMARTGEGREVVADFLDAQAAMDDEMILDLTDGQPTTLVDALTRYLEELERRDELQPRARVAGELAAILAFPWPEDERRVQLHNPHYGLMLHIEEEENRDLVIRMGNNRWEVCRVNWEDAGSGGQRECQAVAEAVAEAVYRATLARVIPDRDHDVRLSGAEARNLSQWLVQPQGSFRVSDRLSLEAYGHGVIVQTRPYSHQSTEDKSLKPYRIKD
jgi:hypothetical protein